MAADKPYLDFYEVDGATRWNWKLFRHGIGELVSQEFVNEEKALDAWRNDLLEWEVPPSFD